MIASHIAPNSLSNGSTFISYQSMTDAHHSDAPLNSIIRFGKFKGRHLNDALHDKGFFEWIQSLSQSPIPKSAEIGDCYLYSLQMLADKRNTGVDIIIERKDLKQQVAIAREKIAELESIYTQEHQAVECIRARLFLLLSPTYEKLDALRIQVDYRRRFLEAILQGDNEKAEVVAEEEQHARSTNQQAYEEAGQSAANKPVLNEQERAELRTIYRKLASLYHPDKYANDPESQDSYIELMKQINQAKDAGAIDTLRDIAESPNRFLESAGRRSLVLDDSSEFEGLQLLYIKLLERIGEVQKQLDELRSSSDYELWKLCEQDPDLLDTIAEGQIRDLEEEALKLEDECKSIGDEINRNLDPESPLRI
jgi:DNA polymerase-3 subunit epsilon